MKVTIHKIASLFLSFALVVTSINVLPADTVIKKVKAEEIKVNLDNVTVDADIVNGGDAEIIRALGSDSMMIDGISYKNYTKYEGVTASASSEKNAAKKAIDGNTDSRWESEHGVDPQHLTVDLGNLYSIKDIAIYWEGASAKEYTVEVSADGINFQTLTQITDTHGKRTDNLNLSDEIRVRTVRISCTARTTNYGDSIFEIGFLFAFLYGLSNVAITINMLLGMLAGGGIFLLITLLGGFFYGKEAMGFGDVKLMAGLGLFFGLSNIIIITLLSFLIGAVLSIVLLLIKIKKSDEYIPFGPFIVIATFISMYVPFEQIKMILMQIFTLGMYHA